MQWLVYPLLPTEKGILCKSIVIRVGAVSRYFSRASRSGVNVTLLSVILVATLCCPVGPEHPQKTKYVKGRSESRFREVTAESRSRADQKYTIPVLFELFDLLSLTP